MHLLPRINWNKCVCGRELSSNNNGILSRMSLLHNTITMPYQDQVRSEAVEKQRSKQEARKFQEEVKLGQTPSFYTNRLTHRIQWHNTQYPTQAMSSLIFNYHTTSEVKEGRPHFGPLGLKSFSMTSIASSAQSHVSRNDSTVLYT